MFLGLFLRELQLAQLRPELIEPALFASPWPRWPILDALSWPLAGVRQHLAIMLSLLVIPGTAALSRSAGGSYALGALAAAVTPSLVLAGGFWNERVLVIPLVTATALALLRALRGASAVPLLLAASATVLADWTGWPPVLAWAGWLAFFRPSWLTAEQAGPSRSALLAATTLGTVSAVLFIVWLGDPAEHLGASAVGLGPRALLDLLRVPGILFLGRFVPQDWPSLLGLALSVGALVAWALRTSPRQLPRAVLAVGLLGALVPALAAHPWLPLAAGKNLWTLTPLALALLVSAWRLPLACAAAVLLACESVDLDADGHDAGEDCDDGDPTVFPDAPALADGRDTDCDGAPEPIDLDRDAEEAEPNDTDLGACFAPDGQDIGQLSAVDRTVRVAGRIDEVVQGSWTEGDRDCFWLRVPPGIEQRRLFLTLAWPEAEADLDVAVWGLWEGEQAGFVSGQAPGPGPEVHVSSAAFDAGQALWLWIAAYEGPATDYTLELQLR